MAILYYNDFVKRLNIPASDQQKLKKYGKIIKYFSIEDNSTSKKLKLIKSNGELQAEKNVIADVDGQWSTTINDVPRDLMIPLPDNKIYDRRFFPQFSDPAIELRAMVLTVGDDLVKYITLCCDIRT